MSQFPVKHPCKKPVLLVGPTEPHIELIKKYSNQGFEIVAADGGANILFEHGIQPAAIIGDLDSLKSSIDFDERTSLIKIEEQDSTDFEKCLYSLDSPLFLAVGFVGQRFDHTLANVHVLTKYASKKNVFLIGPQDFSFAQVGEFSSKCSNGDTVSIFPLAPICFDNSIGLKFPLDGLTLEFGHAIGTSNEAEGEKIRILPSAEHLTTPYLITLALDRLPGFLSSCGH